MTTIRASTQVDYIEHPKGVQKVLNYQSPQISQKCYTCGGNVTIKFMYADSGRGFQDLGYEFSCGKCGLEEFDDDAANIDSDDEGDGYEGYDSKEKCLAAWLGWFKAGLKALTDDGKLPKWLQHV